MGVAWCHDVNQVDIVAGNNLAPVGLVLRKAKLLRCCFDLVFGTTAQNLQDRFNANLRKELGQLAIGIGVCLPHKLITNQRDTNLLGS